MKKDVISHHIFLYLNHIFKNITKIIHLLLLFYFTASILFKV